MAKIITATQYECTFKTPNKQLVNLVNAIAIFPDTYSSAIECTSYAPDSSACEVHNERRTEKKITDPIQQIQEKCIGHRLNTVNGRNYSYPVVTSTQHILAQQYNMLKNIIDNEITQRKKSGKYKTLNISGVASVGEKTKILKQQLANLNNIIANQELYKDLAKKPTLIISNETIQASDINKSISTIKTLANDCICYSDCNGYSVCWCYGNCNHY